MDDASEIESGIELVEVPETMTIQGNDNIRGRFRVPSTDKRRKPGSTTLREAPLDETLRDIIKDARDGRADPFEPGDVPTIDIPRPK